MKIAYTTACVAPAAIANLPEPERSFHRGIECERMIHWLARSAEKFGIPLRAYGQSHYYANWRFIKIDLWVPYLRQLQNEGYTHVFYTDGRDSFMLTSTPEIERKYAEFGSPPYLISCEDQCYPFPNLADVVEAISSPKKRDNPWKYLGAGQMMGEIGYMIDMWGMLEKHYGSIVDENHDQGWLELGFAEGRLNPEEFILDHECKIFQTASLHRLGGDIPNYLELGSLQVRSGRVYNPITGTEPCAIHFPGGYSSPTSGKDHSLGPVWHSLWGDNAYVKERMLKLDPLVVSPALKEWIEQL